MFTNNPPSIDMTMVGFGQAGTRMVDKFAKLKTPEGKFVYNCLALNSNDGDLQELRNVPLENRISLKLGGLGKNPEKAIRILEENAEAKDKLIDFVTKRIRPNDELVLFFAGLGGGTGTSTLVKSVSEFFDHYNKPKIAEELKKIQQATPPDEYKAKIKEFTKLAVKRAMERYVKIGIVVTLPVRSDGPDVLRQVNDFARQIWDMAKNPGKGIAFVIFADNQYFYDKWASLGPNAQAENYRDFANNAIFNAIHEINTATNGGGTSVTFDPRDFRRILMEGTGSLVIGKEADNIKSVGNNNDLTDMFLKSIQTSALHDPIALEEKDDNGILQYAKVHHVGLLAVLDQDLKKAGSSFLDEAKNEIVERLPLQGTVFSGYLEEKTGFKATVYTFYKTLALPKRLTKGLVEEFEDFRSKQRAIAYKTESIEEIAAANDDEALDIEGLELGDLIDVPPSPTEDEDDDPLKYLDDIDVNDI